MLTPTARTVDVKGASTMDPQPHRNGGHCDGDRSGRVLVFVTKDADGNIQSIEFEDHADVALLNKLDGEVGGMISEEDIEYAATELEPNSSAALLIWEDVWATPFVEALRASGGVLIEGARIPHELIEAAEADLAAAG